MKNSKRLFRRIKALVVLTVVFTIFLIIIGIGDINLKTIFLSSLIATFLVYKIPSFEDMMEGNLQQFKKEDETSNEKFQKKENPLYKRLKIFTISFVILVSISIILNGKVTWTFIFWTIVFSGLITLKSNSTEESIEEEFEVLSSEDISKMEQTTVEEAEKEHIVIDGRLNNVPTPFGFMNEDWVSLKAKIQPGDKLYNFSTDKESWENLSGRSGIILVRDNKVIDKLITAMN